MRWHRTRANLAKHVPSEKRPGRPLPEGQGTGSLPAAFDTTLKGFDDRLKVLGEKSRNNLKVHILLLAILLGFVGGMLFAAAGGLWR